MGFDGALEKVFAADPDNVLVVTEHVPGTVVRFAYPSHTLACAKTCDADSSYGYHSMEEVLEHHRFKKGSDLAPERRNGHNRQDNGGGRALVDKGIRPRRHVLASPPPEGSLLASAMMQEKRTNESKRVIEISDLKRPTER